MYIYPDNLKSKASMWLWELKDLAVTGIIVLISVFAICLCKTVVPDGDSRCIRIFNDTGGGYHHLKIYPLCMCVFFGGTAAL